MIIIIKKTPRMGLGRKLIIIIFAKTNIAMKCKKAFAGIKTQCTRGLLLRWFIGGRGCSGSDPSCH